MRKIFIGLFLLVLIGGGVGLYMFNKPLESTMALKSDFTMKAADLLIAFESDETLANSKYLDKVIEVSGYVKKLNVDEGKTTVYLDSDNPMSNVIFQLEEFNTSIKEGEKITLKGVCTGYLMDVVLVRAVRV